MTQIGRLPTKTNTILIIVAMDVLLPNVGTVPDISCIANISGNLQMLTNSGHRFGHQSGLYKSSGEHPAAI